MIDRLTSRTGAAGARWPNDLFRPAPGTRSQTTRFELGEGQTGSATTTIEARRDASGSSIKRTVVTETPGAQRSTHETYTVTYRRAATGLSSPSRSKVLFYLSAKPRNS